jgi:hypothetical protein
MEHKCLYEVFMNVFMSLVMYQIAPDIAVNNVRSIRGSDDLPHDLIVHKTISNQCLNKIPSRLKCLITVTVCAYFIAIHYYIL